MSTLLEVPPTLAVCVRCQKQQPSKPTAKDRLRLPPRWKRDQKQQPVCPACWKQAFILRALTFSIAEPLSGTWKELEADLKPAWIQATQLANWMMTECYARDVRRSAGDSSAKMPPMQRVYLYPEARKFAPGLPPQTIVSIEQAVQRKYRAIRYEVVWTSMAALPTMRYPQPFPINVQSWSYTRTSGDRPVVRFRLGEGVKWWEVRLKSGPQFRRQLDGLKRMAERGEMALYKAHDGTILVKLVGWLNRSTRERGPKGMLAVRTADDALLVAVDTEGDRLWVENCDHLKRWIVEHNRRIQRLSEDQKAEQRPVPGFAQRREHYVIKQRNRVQSAIKEVAAHLGNFAARRGYSSVRYDDSGHGFMGDKFPYYLLAERIKVVLDEKGIGFEKLEKNASAGVKDESPEPLAEGEQE